MIKNKDKFQDNPTVSVILDNLEEAIRIKDDFAISILTTRLKLLGLKLRRSPTKKTKSKTKRK